jgi:hypothetical protein
MKPSEREAVIRGLREKIGECERVIHELPILRQALAIFEAEGVTDASRQLPLTTVDSFEKPVPLRMATIGPVNVVKDSVGYHALEILKNANRPMRVPEIMAALRARGKSNSQATLVSVLCWYYSKDMIKRTAASTYAIPTAIDAVKDAIKQEQSLQEAKIVAPQQ